MPSNAYIRAIFNIKRNRAAKANHTNCSLQWQLPSERWPRNISLIRRQCTPHYESNWQSNLVAFVCIIKKAIAQVPLQERNAYLSPMHLLAPAN